MRSYRAKASDELEAMGRHTYNIAIVVITHCYITNGRIYIVVRCEHRNGGNTRTPRKVKYAFGIYGVAYLTYLWLCPLEYFGKW